jgi:nicotinamide-nucleotide amidase
MFAPALLEQAAEILALARAKGLRIAAAESCTGGLIAALLTSIAGSSDVFERGFVTYSNEAKEDLLDVPTDLIHEHGAVSLQVAMAMADGALKHSLAQIAVSVTGIAGPGGGSADKPVGLVYIATAALGEETEARELRLGDIGRDTVRLATVEAALALLHARLSGTGTV